MDGPTAAELEALRVLSGGPHRGRLTPPPGRPAEPAPPDPLRAAEERTERRMHGFVSSLQRRAEQERGATAELGRSLSASFDLEIGRAGRPASVASGSAEDVGTQPPGFAPGPSPRTRRRGGQRGRSGPSAPGRGVRTSRSGRHSVDFLPVVGGLPSRRTRRLRAQPTGAGGWLRPAIAFLFGLVVVALLYETHTLSHLLGAPRW